MRKFNAHFVDDPPIDKVLVAVAPMDAFSGRLISSGVEVRIGLVRNMGGQERVEPLPNRPIRNLSGLLVFINIPEKDDAQQKIRYRIVLDATAAGYFDPSPVDFVAPDPDDLNWARERRKNVPLYRRPILDLDTEGTIVAGVVERAPGPSVEPERIRGVQIRALLPNDLLPPPVQNEEQPPKPFETRSDHRGAFALPLRLPAADEVDQSVPVTFVFQKDGDQRTFRGNVHEGKFHSFKEPINLIGGNEPPLLPFGG